MGLHLQLRLILSFALIDLLLNTQSEPLLFDDPSWDCDLNSFLKFQAIDLILHRHSDEYEFEIHRPKKF